MPHTSVPRIAYLEDEPETAEAICGWIREAGMAVDLFNRGADCARAVERGQYAACLLDWLVPDMSGPEVLARLRLQLKDACPPVIFLTARDSEDDVVHMLSAGAVDYLVKPVSRPILLARLNVVLHRSGLKQETRRRAWGQLEVDFDTRQFFVEGRRVELTELETGFALHLLQNVGRLLTRAHLLQTVWGHNTDVESRKVDVQASALRRKLKLSPESGWRLVSVYGQGYRLEWLHD
jgi:two-component system, OmpR family, response regulator RegX3